MRMCKLCSREFSRPYNLRRHITRFHQPEIPSDSDKMKTVKSWLDASATQALQQTGGGAGGGSEGGDIEDTNSETSTQQAKVYRYDIGKPISVFVIGPIYIRYTYPLIHLYKTNSSLI